MRSKFDVDTNSTEPALNPERMNLLELFNFDKTIVRAQGAYVYDAQDRAYLDFCSQFGAIPFGHNAGPIWNTLMTAREAAAPALSQPLLNQQSRRLAQRLLAMSPKPMHYVTFVTSGAEAVEAGFKLARANTRKNKIVYCHHAYHGKTFAALSATANPRVKDYIFHDTANFTQITAGDLEALQAAVAKGDCAAFIVELVQSEGGVHLPEESFLNAAAALCRRRGVRVIVDEVQTGMGRLGSVFGCEQYPHLHVDILLLSKAMGGGLLPIGAMLCNRETWCADFGNAHSSTFANNGLTCAIANTVLDELTAHNGAILANVNKQGEHLGKQLCELAAIYPDVIGAVRGKGLLWGIEFAHWHAEGAYFLSHQCSLGAAVPLICSYLLNRHHILTAPANGQPNVLRLSPPLNVVQPQIERVIGALRDVLDLIDKRRFDELYRYSFDKKPKRKVNGNTPPAGHIQVQRINDASSKAAATHSADCEAAACAGRFAFFMHPTDIEALRASYPASFRQLPAPELERLNRWVDAASEKFFEAGVACYTPRIRDRHGAYVEGWLISSALTPEQMLRLPKEKRSRLIDSYFKAAAELEVDRVGLGAFTSIITRGGEAVKDNPYGIDITSGNSLTGISAAETLIQALRQNRNAGSEETVAIIGAAGSTGRVSALHLSRSFESLMLFGNPRNRQALKILAQVAGEIYHLAFLDFKRQRAGGMAAVIARLVQRNRQLESLLQGEIDTFDSAGSFETFYQTVNRLCREQGIGTGILLSVDLERDLRNAGLVLSATSEGRSFIAPAWLRHGAIVCDAARPSDLQALIHRQRPDIELYEGGVLSLPDPTLRFGASNILGFPDGVNLACLAETISLTLACRKGNFSLGKRIDYEQALVLYEQAIGQGFSVNLYQPHKYKDKNNSRRPGDSGNANQHKVAV